MDLATLKKTFAERSSKKVKVGGFDVDGVLRGKYVSLDKFWCFKETPESLHEKGFRDLTPLSPGMFGYSWLREEQHKAFCHAILDEMAAFDCALEALHTETGPGVYEV